VRVDGRFLQLVAAPAACAPGRVGYIIPRRAIPRAVDRNYLRRRLREVARAARPPLERFDVILRVRQPIARADLAAASSEARELMRRAIAPTP
jgi:ribonuclease P protein component